ncbi:hypothetical protein [Nonomuraea sp. NPDC050202]
MPARPERAAADDGALDDDGGGNLPTAAEHIAAPPWEPGAPPSTR